MSEKINELIKSVKDLKYDASTGTFETDRRALFEFAELIIKETLQVARAGVEFGNGMEDAVYNYFGVEE